MRDFRDAKAMAQGLREALRAKSVSLTHSESLELIAKALGLPDWNVLAARIQASQPAAAGSTPATVLPAGADIPIIPLRDLVLFPQMVTPIFVGRDKTRRAVESAMARDGRILVVTQKRSADDDPALDALHPVGVTASVIHRLTLADNTQKIFVSGHHRTAIVRPVEGEFLAAEAAPIEETGGQSEEAFALARAVLDAYQVYVNVDFSARPQGLQARFSAPSIGHPGLLADSVAPLLPLGIDKRQQLLETIDVVTRLEAILDLIKVSGRAA